MSDSILPVYKGVVTSKISISEILLQNNNKFPDSLAGKFLYTEADNILYYVLDDCESYWTVCNTIHFQDNTIRFPVLIAKVMLEYENLLIKSKDTRDIDALREKVSSYQAQMAQQQEDILSLQRALESAKAEAEKAKQAAVAAAKPAADDSGAIKAMIRESNFQRLLILKLMDFSEKDASLMKLRE